MRADDLEEFTGVFAAVQSGNLKALRFYLEVDPLSCSEALESGPFQGCTPFGLAIKSGNVEAVKLFIEHGFNLNVPLLFGEYQGFSPFMLAISFGLLELVKLFLENGADIANPISIGELEGQTPLCVAAQLAKMQPERIDIVEFLLSTGIAFDAKLSKTVWTGKSVVDYVKKVDDPVLLGLFESEEKRMNILLNLVRTLLSIRISPIMYWVCEEDGFHYLCIKSSAQNIQILNLYCAHLNILPKIDDSGCTLYIKKIDLAKNISTLTRDSEKWGMFYDQNSFLFELTPTLERVIGQGQSWLEDGYFYIVCNKRGAYILRDFLSELHAEMQTEQPDEDPFNTIMHKNFFRIPCENLSTKNKVYFDGLIFGIEVNLGKLDRFREMAKNCGKSVINGKPNGISVIFHRKRDEELLKGFIGSYFENSSSLYPYEKILDIPDSDFDKICLESEKIKLQKDSIDENKVQGFQETMKCLVPDASNWIHDDLFLDAKNLKPKCMAVFARLKEALPLVLHLNERQVRLNKMHLSFWSNEDIQGLRDQAQGYLDHLHALASIVAKVSRESKKDLFQENGLIFSCIDKKFESIFNEIAPQRLESSNSHFISYDHIFNIRNDKLIELKQNIDKLTSPKLPSVSTMEVKKPVRIRKYAASFYSEILNNKTDKEEKVPEKAPKKKAEIPYVSNLPKEERIPKAFYPDLIKKTLAANPEQSEPPQEDHVSPNLSQKMPSLGALIHNQINLISKHLQDSLNNSDLLVKKHQSIKECVEALANFCETTDLGNELDAEVHQFMRACWGSSVLSFTGIWVLANWAEKIIQGASETPGLGF